MGASLRGRPDVRSGCARIHWFVRGTRDPADARNGAARTAGIGWGFVRSGVAGVVAPSRAHARESAAWLEVGWVSPSAGPMAGRPQRLSSLRHAVTGFLKTRI